MLVVFGINKAYKSHTRQGLIFLLFGSVAFVGAIFSWAYLPDSQRWVVEPTGDGREKRVLETKTLEELGEGRERARQAGELVTIKERWGELRSRRRERRPRQEE